MTHIICITHNRDEIGFENFKKGIESLQYTLSSGADYEVGNKANPKVAELRLVDVIVKDCYKEQFLSHIKAEMPHIYLDTERFNKSDDDGTPVRHGVGGKGFKLSVFRKLCNFFLKFLNCKPIDMQKITKEVNPQLREHRIKNSWKGYCMVIGELPDGKSQKGRENS